MASIYMMIKIQCSEIFEMEPSVKSTSYMSWGHGALVQSPVAGTPGKCFFPCTKTRQDQALPRHFDGKIWPHSTQFWSQFFLSVPFLGHPVYRTQFQTNLTHRFFPGTWTFWHFLSLLRTPKAPLFYHPPFSHMQQCVI